MRNGAIPGAIAIFDAVMDRLQKDAGFFIARQ